MAKDFSAIYSQGDSIGLEYKTFIKEETTKGTFEIPAGTDFIDTLSGTTGSLALPFSPSPSKSGRHNQSVIIEKEATTWSVVSLFNFTETGAWAATGVDLAWRALMKNLLGKETVNASDITYDTATPPSTSFTMLQNGDVQGLQFVGAFANTAEFSLPGDGYAQQTFSGNAKTMYRMGIGQTTTDNNSGNTITLQSGEGSRFEENGYIMIITDAAGGATRSADTPDGSPRKVTDITGDVLTVDGAVLADADGDTGGAFYVCYYEPTTPSAKDTPVTGLTGSVSFSSGLTKDCVRSINFSIDNQHEIQDYCYGKSGLSDVLYTAGGKFNCTASIEMNLDHELVGYLNDLKDIVDETLTVTLGDTANNYMEWVSKLKFAIPEIPVPDSGSVVVNLESLCFQSATDAADEFTVKYRT